MFDKIGTTNTEHREDTDTDLFVILKCRWYDHQKHRYDYTTDKNNVKVEVVSLVIDSNYLI